MASSPVRIPISDHQVQILADIRRRIRQEKEAHVAEPQRRAA